MENGDIERRTSEWLSGLRREFVRIASRRVDESDVEDVVQEAMRVIAEKGIDRGADPVDGFVPLAWCFQVLRNTIGNHYQRQRTRQRWTETDPVAVDRAHSPRVSESMDSQTTLALVEDALDDMARTDAKCADYLTRLADGARAGDIADDEAIGRAVFYRRLYRCRQKLRDLLTSRGVVV
jgi:RNA polymerase sigma factor (sigma-70 family)